MTRSVDFYHTDASKENRHISGTCLSKRSSTVFVHHPLWYLLTPYLLLLQILQIWRLQKIQNRTLN